MTVNSDTHEEFSLRLLTHNRTSLFLLSFCVCVKVEVDFVCRVCSPRKPSWIFDNSSFFMGFHLCSFKEMNQKKRNAFGPH